MNGIAHACCCSLSEYVWGAMLRCIVLRSLGFIAKMLSMHWGGSKRSAKPSIRERTQTGVCHAGRGPISKCFLHADNRLFYHDGTEASNDGLQLCTLMPWKESSDYMHL